MTKGFIAVNHIKVRPDYEDRMVQLFQTRAGKIDDSDGFRSMRVLKPQESGGPYLVISEWDSEEHFHQWSRSDAFRAGHKRAFADLAAAEARGEQPPMVSEFKTFELIAD